MGWLLPLFGTDVQDLQPGHPAVIDGRTLGSPTRSLNELPAGEYYVQALLNVYTQFHRADGHVIWAHMDQWEGQKFSESPGNLFSKPLKLRVDPRKPLKVKLSLTEVIPPIASPADTEWVKHIKIKSPLLSRFWGHDMYVGATVLLPKGYAAHPDVRYPVVYEQVHFTDKAPFGFQTSETPEEAGERDLIHGMGRDTGYEFYQHWTSPGFPRMIAVRLLHPTPYYDDSYAVNSANNGPYADAIMTELIPYIEAQFRIIREPHARLLTGGSTGGWEALALQIFHPDFFGGTWSFFPDPVDFRRYNLIDIYQDENAFSYWPADDSWRSNGYDRLSAERTFLRDVEGQPLLTVRQLSQFEEVLGTRGRSGSQLEAWEAAYGPVGDDGYPKPLWDKMTGQIDHQVSNYMRDQGYDLRQYVETNWATLGPKLTGKLHISCGEMDDHYLNLAVYLMEASLTSRKNPRFDGSFEFGRPMKGHGWQPVSESELFQRMARYVKRIAPAGHDSGWQYN